MGRKFEGILIEKVAGNSVHHLFDYFEVRSKLMDLFGNPETEEEHEILQRRCKSVMDKMPCFLLEKKFHDDYHKKIQSNKTIKERCR